MPECSLRVTSKERHVVTAFKSSAQAQGCLLYSLTLHLKTLPVGFRLSGVLTCHTMLLVPTGHSTRSDVCIWGYDSQPNMDCFLFLLMSWRTTITDVLSQVLRICSFFIKWRTCLFSVTGSHALLLLVTYGSLTYLLLCLESLTKGRLTWNNCGDTMNSLWAKDDEWGQTPPGKGFTLQAGQRWASNLKSSELCISDITENKLEQPLPHPIFKALCVPTCLYPLFWELQWLCWAVVHDSVCIFYRKLVTGMLRLDNTGERGVLPPFRWRSLNIPSFLSQRGDGFLAPKAQKLSWMKVLCASWSQHTPSNTEYEHRPSVSIRPCQASVQCPFS